VRQQKRKTLIMQKEWKLRKLTLLNWAGTDIIIRLDTRKKLRKVIKP